MKLSVEWPAVDDGFAYRRISIVARRLHRTLRSRSHDLDDIEQHLTAELWKCRERFDACRGSWEAFVTRVLRTAAAKLHRYSRTAKRDDRNNVALASEDMVPIVPRGTDLRIDLATAIKRLSRSQRLFLAAIGNGPRDEVRATLGISRRKFDSRKKSLVRTLRELDLDEYCC